MRKTEFHYYDDDAGILRVGLLASTSGAWIKRAKIKRKIKRIFNSRILKNDRIRD
jgi:hypothetical protein